MFRVLKYITVCDDVMERDAKMFLNMYFYNQMYSYNIC